MMKIRKNFRNYFLCLSLLLLSSCVTKYLWGDKSYEEEITQSFVGADGRYVVFVAKNYHYIFTDNSSVLKEILGLKQKDTLSLSSKTYVKLDENNDLQGVLIFEGPYTVLPVEDKMTLKSMGLFPNQDGDITIKIPLSGRRYSARYLGQTSSAPVDSSYKLTVYYKGDYNLVKGVGKAAITPVAVTLDAVLLIGKVVIFPIAMVYDE